MKPFKLNMSEVTGVHNWNSMRASHRHTFSDSDA